MYGGGSWSFSHHYSVPPLPRHATKRQYFGSWLLMRPKTQTNDCYPYIV